MAPQAVLLKNGGVARLDADRLVEVLEGEAFGMVVAITGLREHFPREINRQVAVDAGGHGVVTGLLPRVELSLHDVAVHTCLGVTTQVGKSLGITEGVTADADQNSQGNTESHNE